MLQGKLVGSHANRLLDVVDVVVDFVDNVVDTINVMIDIVDSLIKIAVNDVDVLLDVVPTGDNLTSDELEGPRLRGELINHCFRDDGSDDGQ